MKRERKKPSKMKCGEKNARVKLKIDQERNLWNGLVFLIFDSFWTFF